MPQLINLGGFVLQKTESVRVNLLRSRDLDTPYIEIDINDQSVYLRNVSEIHAKDGTVINAETIQVTT
jgi:hypothetical protein